MTQCDQRHPKPAYTPLEFPLVTLCAHSQMVAARTQAPHQWLEQDRHLPGMHTKLLLHWNAKVTITETKMSSFWQNFHHWLHWKLSFWQLPMQPLMKVSSKWQHFHFSDGDNFFLSKVFFSVFWLVMAWSFSARTSAATILFWTALQLMLASQSWSCHH